MKLTDEYRRALGILAESPDGCTDHVLHLFGFSDEVMDNLIRAGLAIAEPKYSSPERRAVKVRRIRITDAGRKAL